MCPHGKEANEYIRSVTDATFNGGILGGGKPVWPAIHGITDRHQSHGFQPVCRNCPERGYLPVHPARDSGCSARLCGRPILWRHRATAAVATTTTATAAVTAASATRIDSGVAGRDPAVVRRNSSDNSLAEPDVDAKPAAHPEPADQSLARPAVGVAGWITVRAMAGWPNRI